MIWQYEIGDIFNFIYRLYGEKQLVTGKILQKKRFLWRKYYLVVFYTKHTDHGTLLYRSTDVKKIKETNIVEKL
jgi:hypothetical protein